jgi:hypothetical protein
MLNARQGSYPRGDKRESEASDSRHGVSLTGTSAAT